MRFDILSLFPDYFEGPLNEGILQRAIKKGIINIQHVDIRQFAMDKHHKVDERPYGGGPGMVMMPGPTKAAISSVKRPEAKVIYLSPQGKTLTAQKCRELAQCPHLVLLCGHYEGIDERIIENEVDEEISIGDYVLTNGCLPAIVLLNAVVRYVKGVIGDELSVEQDSFEQGLLDHPHYTRPEEFEGRKVPEVLLSGNHQKIAEWRQKAALTKTRDVRPDLL